MRWTVGRKVVATLLIVVTGAVVAAWTALQLASDANDATTAIHRDEVQGFVTLAETVEAANEIRRRGLIHVLARSAGDMREQESKIATRVVEVERNLDRLEVNWAGQQSKLALLAEVREEWERYSADRRRTLRLSSAGDFERARTAAMGVTARSFQELEETFVELIGVNEERAAAHVTSAREEFSDGRARVIFVISLATLLGLVLTLIVVRRLTTDIGRIAAAAGGLAAGDLAQRAEVSGKDELQDMAQGFNSMADRLEQMVEEERESRSALQTAVADYSQFAAQLAAGDLTVRVSADGSGELDSLTRHLNGMAEALADISREVRTSAHDVGASAAEILATVNQHTTSATEQSAAVAETTATIDEVRATAEQVAEKAKEVADQSQNSVQASSEAAESVDAIVSGMSDIKTRVDAIAQQILELSEQTQRIGEITDTVNDIADQSNLLALNATIEAAKAGEHGKGFAVVADEVRNLADQSKEAAAQVRSILGDIRKGTDSAVMTTEEGARVVERGAGLAANAGEYIDQLADVIRGGADAAQQITASAHQQRIGMDQISHAMADINQATTQFVAGARQSQQAAADLHDLAARLQAMTERYKV